MGSCKDPVASSTRIASSMVAPAVDESAAVAEGACVVFAKASADTALLDFFMQGFDNFGHFAKMLRIPIQHLEGVAFSAFLSHSGQTAEDIDKFKQVVRVFHKERS